MNPAIEAKGISKFFAEGFFQKKKQVLFDVNFQIKALQTTGFVGANGSGKTTTLKCLLEFLFPESGQALFFGKPLSTETRKNIGYLPERPYYQEFLTALEFLKFHWNLRGESSKDFMEQATIALKKVDLFAAKDQKIKSFSKGMMQRIGLAQAILGHPELLILDEPMSGLDPDGRLMVKDILKDQKQKGVTIFFSSHLLQDMEELCNELLLINKGKIIYNGDQAQFKAQFSSLEEAYRSFRDRSEGVRG